MYTDCDKCGERHELFPSACCFWEDTDRCQPCNLVDEATRAAEKDEYEQLPPTEQPGFLASIGVNSWFHGFLDIPGISQVLPALICPFDFMHCAAEGQLKVEVAAFFFVAIKRRKWFTYQQLQQSWNAFPWPKHQGRIPFPVDTFLEGRKGATSLPKKSIHFHWTAAQARAFLVTGSRPFPPLPCPN